MIHQRRRWRLIFVLAVLLAVVIWMGMKLSQTWRAAKVLQADLTSVEALVGAGGETLDVTQAIEVMHRTRADLLALESAARPFLWLAPHLGWVPRYGSAVQAAPTFLETGLQVTAAGERVLDPLGPLLTQTGGENGTDRALPRQAAAALMAAQPQLQRAEASIRKATAAREAIDARALDPRLHGWLVRLDRYLPLLEEVITGGLLMPEVLGADGPRTYLILVQNEDELRATGGFISGVVEATVERGQLVSLQFEDSYAVDDFSQPYPQPPEPLRAHMHADLWVFRDSNWSPDFPTSAEKAIELYSISREAELDGVVALDQQAIRLLVGALGPLQVETSLEPVTGDNVIQLARLAWSPRGAADREWWGHRKDFMGAVIDAAVRQAQGGLDGAGLVRLGKAAGQALRQRHLLVYLRDEAAASLLAKACWDGALLQEPGDYLTVVDSNVGFNKVNGLVKQDLAYMADLSDPDRPRAALVVQHEHPLGGWRGPCNHRPRYDETYAQMMERCYWDYLRVYVPSGAELLGATPHVVPGEALLSGVANPAEVTVQDAETGHRVFATLLLIRPGERLQTRFEYALPADILASEGNTSTYSLRVQKQPGTQTTPLQVQILLPPDAAIEESVPEPDATQDSSLMYTLTLETDRTIRIRFVSRHK